MNEIASSLGSIQQIADTYLNNKQVKSQESSEITNSFESILRKRLVEESGLKFSKHAAKRLDEKYFSIRRAKRKT